MMTTIYNFHPETGELVSESAADVSPLEPGVILMPAFSTEVEPPAAPGHVAVMTAAGWSLVEDIRGSWYNADHETLVVDDLNADVTGLTRRAPPGFDYELLDGEWVQSADRAAALLAAAKAAKNDQINAWRMTANTTTFTHAGKVFDCDALSRGDIDGTNGTVTLTGEFPPNWPGGWKAVDNSYIEITTREQWQAFFLSMCATGAANFAHAQSLKTTLAQATTAEQIAAIVW